VAVHEAEVLHAHAGSRFVLEDGESEEKEIKQCFELGLVLVHNARGKKRRGKHAAQLDLK
jgi:hypothetical protein